MWKGNHTGKRDICRHFVLLRRSDNLLFWVRNSNVLNPDYVPGFISIDAGRDQSTYYTWIRGNCGEAWYDSAWLCMNDFLWSRLCLSPPLSLSLIGKLFNWLINRSSCKMLRLRGLNAWFPFKAMDGRDRKFHAWQCCMIEEKSPGLGKFPDRHLSYELSSGQGRVSVCIFTSAYIISYYQSMTD